MVCLLLCCRIGEAQVPGPAVDTTWSIGICNPSGLQGKYQILNSIDADVLAISESHLTKGSTRGFATSLKAMSSRYKKVLTGAPLAARANSSEAGQYAGVAFAATVPSRTVAAPWPPDVYETSRIQFGSFFTSVGWATGAVVYGYPAGKTHADAHHQTEQLLDFAFSHLQTLHGPRFFSGDWNFEPSDLEVVARLQAAGWVEVQDLFQARTGAPVQPTCKGVTRKDHLWLSPELVLAFLDLTIDHETFADHSVLVARFAGGVHHMEHLAMPQTC